MPAEAVPVIAFIVALFAGFELVLAGVWIWSARR